ncbi:hypothetical protein KEM56_002686 [Ascosphaera pollenicola]|nr:hypothetical protein KEM56_002686 [Ascosphaera pollenicola]
MAGHSEQGVPADSHRSEASPQAKDEDHKYEDVSASTVFVSKEQSSDDSDHMEMKDNASSAGWEGSDNGDTEKVEVKKELVEVVSEKTVPAQTPSTSAPAAADAPAPASPKKSQVSCPTCLASHLDSFIRRLTKLVSTNTGEDRFIGTCGYVAQIIHYLISPAFASLINRYRSLRGKSLIVAPSVSNKDAAKISPRLLALSALASETRTTLRLLGLFPLLTWGSSTLKSPPKDKILGPITFTQIISIILYQFLENVAWLTSKGVLPPNNFIVRRLGGIPRTFIHSVRFWLFYIVLQLFKLARERQLARQARLTKEATGRLDKEALQAETQGLRAAKQSLVSSLSWLPLCMHWSFENGIGVPQEAVGLLSFTAGAWALKDLWAATADAA